MRLIPTLIFALTLGAGSQPALAQSALIDGEVMRVDQPAAKITIKHGPIKKLGMDVGMTMVFQARDTTMLQAVKAGDKVKFDAEQVKGQFFVTKLEMSK